MDIDKFASLIRAGTLPFISILIFIALIIFRKPTVALLKRLLRIKVDKTGTEIELDNTITAAEIEGPSDQRALAVIPVEVEQSSVQTASEIDKTVTFNDVGDALGEKDREKAESLYREMCSKESDPIEKEKMEIFWNYLLSVSGDSQAILLLTQKTKAELKSTENRKVAVELLGSAYERASAYQDAVDVYQIELERNSDETIIVDLNIRIARCESKLGHNDAAVERIICQVNAVDNENLLSRCYRAIHELSGPSFIGLSALEKAISLRPTDPELRFKAGYDSKQSTLSLMHYSIALRFDAKNAASLNNIGVSCSSLGMKMKAVDYYNQSLLQGESLAAANIADMYIKAGFYEDAKRVLESTNGLNELHKNVGQEQSLLISSKADEDGKFKTNIDKGSIQHRYLVAFAEAVFQKAGVNIKENSKWIDDSGQPVTLSVASQRIEGYWGKDNSNKIVGVLQNRGAIVDKFELEFEFAKMERAYKLKKQAYIYVTSSMNEVFFMETDDSDAIYVRFHILE